MAKSKAGDNRGGHRKGAGRPRQSKSGKSSYFSTRIEPQLRAQLEAESRLSGKSLSWTIEQLLKFGLREKAESDRPIKALCYLITLLSEQIAGPFDHLPEYNWRQNPFMFEAFRVAVSNLLDALRPPGEIIPPPTALASPLPAGGPGAPPPNFVDRALDYYFDTPEHRGQNAAWALWCQLRLASPRYPSEKTAGAYGREFADALDRMLFSFESARRDLGISTMEKTEKSDE